MYEAMDLFHRHASAVEESVFFETASLLNLEVDLVFYDTTTCSFAIDEADDPEDGLRLRGHAKDGTWSPQVVVALAVTREGFPVRSWVFHGNTTDVNTVTRVREELRGWKLGRALFVADAGMNSFENQEELARGCGRFVLAVRASSLAEVKGEVLSHPGRFRELRDNLHVKEVVVGEGERHRRYIVCFNPKEAVREARHREELVRMLESELASHPNAEASAQWAIELQASQRFKRYLRVEEGKLLIDQAAVKAADRYDGRWVLLTNDDTLSAEDAADAYKGLMVIERCFRSLKSTQIHMGPMYHWLPRRIETHVKICVLALLIERVAEASCKATWASLRNTLSTLQATEFRDGTHRFFRASELTEAAKAVLNALHIQPPKTIIKIGPVRAAQESA
jgi:transposase